MNKEIGGELWMKDIIMDTMSLRLHLLIQIYMCISQFETMDGSPGTGITLELSYRYI